MLLRTNIMQGWWRMPSEHARCGSLLACGSMPIKAPVWSLLLGAIPSPCADASRTPTLPLCLQRPPDQQLLALTQCTGW